MHHHSYSRIEFGRSDDSACREAIIHSGLKPQLMLRRGPPANTLQVMDEKKIKTSHFTRPVTHLDLDGGSHGELLVPGETPKGCCW